MQVGFFGRLLVQFDRESNDRSASSSTMLKSDFEIGLVPFRTYKLIVRSIYPSDTSRLEVIINYALEAGRPKRQNGKKREECFIPLRMLFLHAVKDPDRLPLPLV